MIFQNWTLSLHTFCSFSFATLQLGAGNRQVAVPQSDPPVINSSVIHLSTDSHLSQPMYFNKRWHHLTVSIYHMY